MSNLVDEQSQQFNRLQGAIASGNCVIVLGPSTNRHAVNTEGKEAPDPELFIKEFALRHPLMKTEGDNLPLDEYRAFVTRNPESRRSFLDLARQVYTIRRAAKDVSIIPTLVWRRIYSLDLSNNIELTYARAPNKAQELAISDLNSPLGTDRHGKSTLNFVKMFGDPTREEGETYLIREGYSGLLRRSAWMRSLIRDAEQGPIIFTGEMGDAAYLMRVIRELFSLSEVRGENIVVVVPGLASRHKLELSEHDAVIFDLSCYELCYALEKVFPHGRTIVDILESTSALSFKEDRSLAGIVEQYFDVISSPNFMDSELSKTVEPEGSIRRFYRGDDITWKDIFDGIYADLKPYKSLLYQFERYNKIDFPSGRLFLLTSPAGMGKTVGLMAIADKIRHISDVSMLWLNRDGDLSDFLIKLDKARINQRIMLLIDDITIFTSDFDSLNREMFKNVCIIATSRETRWHKFGGRISSLCDVVQEPLRLLSQSDASALLDRFERFGTVVHLKAKERDARVQEIIQRSQRDLLVLVREIGQGARFEETVESELADLSDAERFAYYLICITDRIQLSLPRDLFDLALIEKYPSLDPHQTLLAMGRLVQATSRGRALRSRHARIADWIVERDRRVSDPLMYEAFISLLSAFGNFRRPIVVFHGNTAHGRVFKAAINNRFLEFVFGATKAIQIYQRFEKLFEQDAFFWQQFGLIQLRSGSVTLALEKLEHANAIHQHFQIRHSLAAAKLIACQKLGIQELGLAEFNRLREEARAALRSLHAENRQREDKPMATLVNLDLTILQESDSTQDFAKLKDEYFRELAFYLRDYPEMSEARLAYDKLKRTFEGATEKLESEGFDAFIDDF